MIRRLVLAPLLVAPLLIGACGGDDDDAGPAERDASENVEEFCAALERYAEASSDVDTSSVESMVADFEELAALHRAAAEAAPEAVKASQDRLADASEELVTAIRGRNLQSMAEFDAASAEITEALTEEYGDLDAETREVEELADDRCNVQLGE